jgi:zinc/manganese transport system substrate-binding protein
MIIVLAAASLGCRPAQNTNSGKKSIVVTYSILGTVVKELVGDLATVTVSIPNGLDPHEWEPSARDIEAINKADLLVRNGLGLEAGMEKALSAALKQGVRTFTASDHVDVRHVGPGEGIPSGDPDQTTGAADPHLWMDPLAVKSVVVALSQELQTGLGLNAAARAKDIEDRLTALDSQVSAMVSGIPQENRMLVTGHESMGYFARRYGFKLIGVIIPSLSTQAEVSASNLADLKTLIEQNGVKAIFTELGTSPSVAKTIGDETGVRVIQLSTHVLPADGSYFTFFTDLAGAITSALRN